MHLAVPRPEHYLELMSWFPTSEKLYIWSGPDFRYPFNEQSFVEDLNIDKIETKVLLEGQQLLGFGQLYERQGRCHLGRLVVNPQYRGKQIGEKLIHQLMQLGDKILSTNGYSLFVLQDNLSAIKLYRRMGFEFAQYQKPMKLENCLYMVKDCIKNTHDKN